MRTTVGIALALMVSACAFDPGGPTVDGVDGDNGFDSLDPAEIDGSGPSCADILADGNSEGDGVYQITPAGSEAFSAYCDMTTMGGGWTLALKIDGDKPTFDYDSAEWTSQNAYAPDQPDLDTTEAKLDTYTQVSFDQILVVNDVGGVVSRIRIDHSATSLYDVFSPGALVTFSMGRSAWLDSVAGASLQDNCNLEGFNIANGYNKVRLGIVGNNENDCESHDSRIGIGAGGCADCGCDGMDGPRAGNNDAGCNLVSSMSAVFVR